MMSRIASLLFVATLGTSTLLAGCAVEDDGTDVGTIDDADLDVDAPDVDVDVDVDADAENEHEVTVLRAPSDEPSVTTPPSHPIRCWFAGGFGKASRAKNYCRTGISGAGELVSTKVTRGTRGYDVNCCYRQ